jgi:hypothetical protein
LLFAKGSSVFRAVPRGTALRAEPERIADLGALGFEAVPPPPEALHWNSAVTGRRLK